jgi:hypothetical protein
MADLLRLDPDQVGPALLADIARVGAMEVVGHPPAEPVELDPEDDFVAVRQRLAFPERQVLRGQYLQLHRDREPVVRPARPEPEEALARLEHGPCRHGLEAVEVSQAIGIGLIGPGEPETLDPVLERAVLDQTRWLDPAADGVGGEARRRIGGIRLVRTSCRARARCSSPPWRIRLLMLSLPARHATKRRCICAPSNPVLTASFPVARSRAAPAMRETRFKDQ